MSGDSWQADFAAEHGVTVDEISVKAKQVTSVFTKACDEVGCTDFEMSMIAAFLVDTILLTNPAFAMLAFKVGTSLIGGAAPNLTPEQLVKLGAMPMPSDEEGSIH